MFHYIIVLFVMFNTAFAGSLDTNSDTDTVTRRMADENRLRIGENSSKIRVNADETGKNTSEIAELKKRVARLERRQDRLCVGSAAGREVVCKQDLQPLIRRIERLERVCSLPVQERGNLVCSDRIDKIDEDLKKRGVAFKNLKTKFEARRFSLGAGFGPQGTFIPTYGSVGLLSTNVNMTFETAVMGFTIQAGGQFAPNLTSVGGGATAALFWKLSGMEYLAFGPLLGGESNDYGLDGSYYQQKVYGPVVGGFGRFTMVDEDIFALDFTVRGGVKAGVHNWAPGVVGGNGINKLGVTPFAGVQAEIRFFGRDKK